MSTLAERLTSEVAHAACMRLQRQTIRFLCQCRDKLSGDDSELENAWDEICAQIQGEQSFFWDEYLDTARDFIRAKVDTLTRYKQVAIWAATDTGKDWIYDHPDQAVPAVDLYDVAEHVLNEYVLQAAQEWSNFRLRRYFRRVSASD